MVVEGNTNTGNARASRCTSSVAEASNGKTYDSCYLCEASVVNPAVLTLSGLQCKGELVKDSTAACDVSHISQCESTRVTKAVMGSNASHSLKQCETIGVGESNTGDSSKNYKVRFVYNSRVVPRPVNAVLARKPAKMVSIFKISKVKLFGAV